MHLLLLLLLHLLLLHLLLLHLLLLHLLPVLLHFHLRLHQLRVHLRVQRRTRRWGHQAIEILLWGLLGLVMLLVVVVLLLRQEVLLLLLLQCLLGMRRRIESNTRLLLHDGLLLLEILLFEARYRLLVLRLLLRPLLGSRRPSGAAGVGSPLPGIAVALLLVRIPHHIGMLIHITLLTTPSTSRSLLLLPSAAPSASLYS